MKGNIFFTLFLTIYLISCTHEKDIDHQLNPSLLLLYDQPAASWTEALPVGNGRLGAMIYGGKSEEIIQFNEETLWTGQPHNYAHKDAYKVLDNLRQLLWEEKQNEAEELGNERFMSQPLGQLCYQPFGNILLSFPGHENPVNYQRTLDLESAIASVSYDVGDVNFRREIFSSAPAQSLVIRLNSSKKNALNFLLNMNSPHDISEVTVEENFIILKGKANDYPKEKIRSGGGYPSSKLTFEARIKVENEGGEIQVENGKIKVTNANSATLYTVAATNFVNYGDISGNPEERCDDILNKIKGKSCEEIKRAHIADYQEYFNRVAIDLGQSEDSGRPTNERLASFNKDEDPSLIALLYQYGRYLLISSSRPGTQPANLQGIWNDRMVPSWDSKYTININTEMNYWPAEITNLPEMVVPLVQMVQELSSTGQNIAKEHYNQPGWVAHHNTDIWRGAAPINNANHGIWPTGGAWLSQHLWWHYQFNGDKEFLKNITFPILSEASRFFADYLVPDPKNPESLISGPSNSPENGGLVMGPTMDHQIIRELFTNTIEASHILGMDNDFATMLKEKSAKIAPNQVGKYGQLQEWLEDKDDPENDHRHVSHLWGLHPGSEIHPSTTPKLAEACRVTLAHRGDGGTGWSRAWKINFWARLLDGDHAFLILKNLMVPSINTVTGKDEGGLYNNLFDAHPPFQIDGNFGATSGITEMILQSHLRDENGNYFLDILPALPSAISQGSITGIKGRGGFEFGIFWSEGKLDKVEVKSLLGNPMNLRYDGKLISQETDDGGIYNFTIEDFRD